MVCGGATVAVGSHCRCMFLVYLFVDYVLVVPDVAHTFRDLKLRHQARGGKMHGAYHAARPRR